MKPWAFSKSDCIWSSSGSSSSCSCCFFELDEAEVEGGAATGGGGGSALSALAPLGRRAWYGRLVKFDDPDILREMHLLLIYPKQAGRGGPVLVSTMAIARTRG